MDQKSYVIWKANRVVFFLVGRNIISDLLIYFHLFVKTSYPVNEGTLHKFVYDGRKTFITFLEQKQKFAKGKMMYDYTKCTK